MSSYEIPSMFRAICVGGPWDGTEVDEVHSSRILFAIPQAMYYRTEDTQRMRWVYEYEPIHVRRGVRGGGEWGTHPTP